METRSNNFISIIKGIVISFIITIILFYLLGIILSTTSISEKIITPTIIVITGISILIGTSVTMIKSKEKGLIKGRSNWYNIFYSFIFDFKYFIKKF